MTDELCRRPEIADLIAGGGDRPSNGQVHRTSGPLRHGEPLARHPMKARKRDINKIDRPARELLAAEGSTRPAQEAHSSRPCDTVEVITFEITYDVFEDNIEGDNLEDTIIRLFATQIAMDHEELYIMGDSASADPYLALTDGWRKLAKTQGHLYDHQGGGVTVEILGELLDRLPEKYLRDYADLRFYVSPKFEHAYKKILGQRPTPSGDKFLLTDTPATYAGIPLTRVPMIPSNLAATIGGNPFTDLTFVILTLRRNLIVGVHRQMSLERDRNIFARVRQYAFTSRVDATFEEVDAVAIAENISVGA